MNMVNLTLDHWTSGKKQFPKGMTKYRLGSANLPSVTFPSNEVIERIGIECLQEVITVKETRGLQLPPNHIMIMMPIGIPRRKRQAFLHSIIKTMSVEQEPVPDCRPKHDILGPGH